jgi:hypothetical protein
VRMLSSSSMRRMVKFSSGEEPSKSDLPNNAARRGQCPLP